MTIISDDVSTKGEKQKKKIIAILLAILPGGLWTWLYTFKQDKYKFIGAACLLIVSIVINVVMFQVVFFILWPLVFLETLTESKTKFYGPEKIAELKQSVVEDYENQEKSYARKLETKLKNEGIIVTNEIVLSYLGGNSILPDRRNEMVRRITSYKSSGAKLGSAFANLLNGGDESLSQNTFLLLTNYRVIAVFHLYGISTDLYTTWTAYSLWEDIMFTNNSLKVFNLELVNITNAEQFKNFRDTYEKNKEKYISFKSFKDGKAYNGFHEFTQPDGAEVSVEFVNGKTNGFIYIKGDTCQFLGTSLNNVLQGYCIVEYNDGTRIEGDYYDDCFSGVAAVDSVKYGSKYEGEVYKGIQHGYGCLQFLDGTKLYDNFVKGEPSGDGAAYDAFNKKIHLKESVLKTTLNSISAAYLSYKVVSRL